MTTPVVAPRSGLNPPRAPAPTPSDTGATSKKKQHRHSGIFRVADLGPGTMPRGKYPESPAPAGSHAVISRTPTPGGMLHANLGLLTTSPSQLSTSPPQQPSKQTATAPPKKTKNQNPSCCRSCGGMRGWPVHRPTHAPATALKTNGNSVPIKPMSFPSSERVKQSSPPSFQTSGAATAVTENNRRELFHPRRPAARRRRMDARACGGLPPNSKHLPPFRRR